MKIGIVGINTGARSAESMIEFARLAEEVGIESVWTFEHVVVPVDYASAYPYSKDGKMGATPETNMVDPLIALTGIAANTTTLRLGTGVNILPQANPLFLAKQAASLDFMSGGRLMLGVGIGWLAEEFRAMGVPFERRGARYDDYIEAMQKVWTGDVVEHKSEYIDWSGFKSYPLPTQTPLPLVIGGSKGKAFERVARFGQGWYAPTTSVAAVEKLIPSLDAACDAYGRDRSEIEITSMWLPAKESPDVFPQYDALGVKRLLLPTALFGKDPIEGLKKFADEVLPKT